MYIYIYICIQLDWNHCYSHLSSIYSAHKIFPGSLRTSCPTFLLSIKTFHKCQVKVHFYDFRKDSYKKVYSPWTNHVNSPPLNSSGLEMLPRFVAAYGFCWQLQHPILGISFGKKTPTWTSNTSPQFCSHFDFFRVSCWEHVNLSRFFVDRDGDFR